MHLNLNLPIKRNNFPKQDKSSRHISKIAKLKISKSDLDNYALGSSHLGIYLNHLEY